MFDKIIDAEAKLYDKKTKTILMNFNEKNNQVKHKILTFYLHFY